MLNDILTIDQQWLLYRSDFPPILRPWYRTRPSPNYEWFPWSICNGCGMPAGNAYPSGHLVPSPVLGLACWDQIPRTCHVFTRLFTLNTPWYFLDFAYRLTMHIFIETELCNLGNKERSKWSLSSTSAFDHVTLLKHPICLHSISGLICPHI